MFETIRAQPGKNKVIVRRGPGRGKEGGECTALRGVAGSRGYTLDGSGRIWRELERGAGDEELWENRSKKLRTTKRGAAPRKNPKAPMKK